MYTDEQYSMMEFFESGAVWVWHKDPAKDEIILFLDRERLLTPREDIQANYWRLTETGRAALHRHRKAAAESEKQASELAEQKAAQIRDKKKDRIFQVFLVFLGWLLGILTANIGAIISLFRP